MMEGKNMSTEWNELDQRAVKTAKLLAADAVEKAGSGHPGTPISLAAAAYLLYQRHLRFDPLRPLCWTCFALAIHSVVSGRAKYGT